MTKINCRKSAKDFLLGKVEKKPVGLPTVCLCCEAPIAPQTKAWFVRRKSKHSSGPFCRLDCKVEADMRALEFFLESA